jgi:hypothetical protein
MIDVTKTIDSYFAMWNEGDPDERSRLIEEAWVDDGRYCDPVFEAEGHGALNEMVGGAQAQFPGHTVRRTSEVDHHHDQVRFGWELAAADGTVAVAGIDAGAVAPDGRLTRITGFFDPS